MPWRPLPRIAFAVAIYPFHPSTPADLPLELGDELYIIEQGGSDGEWCRGYLVAPPSLLAGLTSTKGQTLEARVFSGIFPRNCVEIREVLGDGDGYKAMLNGDRRSIDRLTLPALDLDLQSRSSVAYSMGDSQMGGEVSDVVVAKKGKPAQIVIHKTEEPDLASPRSVHTYRTGSIPHTPVTFAPRDPDAPKPAAPVPMLKIGDETPTSLTEPLVDEIASCLREWHSTNLHELLLARQYDVLEEMSTLVQELDFSRRQLLHNVLTGKEREALRDETVWKLVRANRMLSGDIIVRDPEQRGRLLTGDDSAIQLAKLQSEMSMLDSRPSVTPDTTALHHLLLEINAVSGNAPGPVSLGIQLYSRSDAGAFSPLSEMYSLDVPSPDKLISLTQGNKLKTLFTELAATDIGDGSANGRQLYLVASVRAPESRSGSEATPVSRASMSRDGHATQRPAAGGVQPSVKGSLRTRRSMMWSPKTRGAPSVDQTSKPASQGVPRTSTSSSNIQEPPQSSSAKESSAIRTLGVGILEVSTVLRQDRDAEQVVNIWSPPRDGEEGEVPADGFDKLLHYLLPSPSGRYVRSDPAARLHLHLRPFTSTDPETLVRENPTILHDVIQTRRIGFSKAPTRPRSDIYITISQAVFPTDALLSHPTAGQVPLQATFALRNMQLTLEVRDASGARVERCVFPSSANTSHTAWRTTITERGAPWNQTIRLKIPTEQIPGSHIIMSVADAPEFPFALAWMPLWDQQAFIRDGHHSLLLHAYDKQTSSLENGKGAYLNLPWSALGKNESAKDEAVTGPLATLRLETHLCSTEYSQDQVILGLLNWRERPVEEVLDTLKRLLFVPEIEIVKQLRGVFDALFGILVENAGNEEYEDLIFNDLVTVLGIVHDRRFNLSPLVDHYTDEQFHFPFVTPCLIRSYLRLLNAATDHRQSRNLRAAFKVGRHLLKFIIKARDQQKAKEEGIGITTVQSTFNRDLHTIFKSMESLMKNASPTLVGSKTLIVQHFHTWLPELSKVLGRDEMIMIALSFMDSCKDVTGMLVLYKLVLIQNYTQFEIFASGDERQTLISSCVGWLAPYWGSTGSVSDQYRDQVRLCSAIVAQLLNQPDPQLYEFMPSIVASYCAIETEGVDETEYLSLLFSKSFPFQVKTSKTPQKFDESLVELSAIIAALAKIVSPKMPALPELELATFLAQAFETHNSIIDGEAYPESWFSIHVYNHRAAIKSLEHLGLLLIDKFLPPPDAEDDADSFDTKLWEAFFTTLLKVISSDALALETFPEQKRRAVWKIAGDVREQGADLLHSTWEAIGWETTDEERERCGLKRLGGYQVQYVPNLVPPIIALCLSVHEGLRHVAVHILRTMILSEWDLNQDISILETEIISSLDSLFKTKHMSESLSQKIFIGELLDLFETDAVSDESLLNAVKNLITTVDELLDLLVASQSSTSIQSLHSLKLMEYMKDMGREDIFIRYVHELAESQSAAGNFTEAGLALQFHADLYEWDLNKPVMELMTPTFPAQSEFERKEALYFSMIQHFENAQAWQHALACYKELCTHYETTSMDFAKLSRAQSSMARIYDLVAKGGKQFPRYFRVVYKGLGFPPSLRDKEFIFEGPPTERMASFVDRMQRDHPTAQIMSSSEISDYEGQFLQISGVTAHRDVTHSVYQRSKIPLAVREHLLISSPSRFSATSRRHTGTSDVREQYVEKLIFTVAESFPNILRRSEVVSIQEVALSPLQTAIERTCRKTQELSILERRAASGEDNGLSNLTEALEQLLELRSPSSNCVALYRGFLSGAQGTKDQLDEVDDEHEEDVPEVMDPMENALAVALIDHALGIKHALALYQRPAHQATQAELHRRFEVVFEPELASLATAPPEHHSPTPTQPAGQSPALSDRRNQAAQRSTSPEQELIRSTRGDGHARKRSERQSVSHRISIMNPFKRSHGASNSIFTIQPSDSKGQVSNEQEEAGDDDAATIHSRATSRSRGGKSEKRRSFFGGDKKQGSSPSIAAPVDDAPGTSLKKRPSRSASRDTAAQSHDSRSRAGSQHRGPTASGAASERPAPASSGGWSTLPPTRDYSRPTTRDSAQAGRDVSSSTNGTPQGPHSTHPNSGVRDSVFRRFSILKGVGRKSSRMDFKANGTLPEE